MRKIASTSKTVVHRIRFNDGNVGKSNQDIVTGIKWGKCSRRAKRTFVHASEAVFQDGELVDLAKFLEERPEVLLVQVAGYLSDE